MKNKLAAFCLVFCIGLQSQGQNHHAGLDKSWKDLTTTIQRRNDVAATLLSSLREALPSDSLVLNQSKAALDDLGSYLYRHPEAPDSVLVQTVYIKTKAADTGIRKALAILEIYSVLKKEPEIAALLIHLDMQEQKLASDKVRYNDLAIEQKREQLVFKSSARE